MIAHAREDAPLECCGLLVGSGEVVDESVRARNLDASPTRYLIDPEAHFATLRRVRAEGRQILGAYHSHPAGPAVPSASDCAEASYPEFVYVIVGFEEGGRADVRAYRIRDGLPHPIDFDTAPRGRRY